MIAGTPRSSSVSRTRPSAHCACLRAGLTSFYGPSIMAGFGENTGPVSVSRRRGAPDAVRAGGIARVAGEHGRMDGRDARLGGSGQPGSRTALRPRRAGDGTAAVRRKARSSRAAWRCSTGSAAPSGFPISTAPCSRSRPQRRPRRPQRRRFLRSLAAAGHAWIGSRAIVFGRPGGATLAPEEHLGYDEAILGVVRDEWNARRAADRDRRRLRTHRPGLDDSDRRDHSASIRRLARMTFLQAGVR